VDKRRAVVVSVALAAVAVLGLGWKYMGRLVPKDLLDPNEAVA
jgi:hypothetical protein